MLEILKNFLYEKYGNTKRVYKIIMFSDLVQTGVCLFLSAWLFGSFWFVVIGSIIMFCLSEYSYHFHCKNLDHCTILTVTMFSVFYFISLNISLYISLFICLFLIKGMYIKMPLKIVNKKQTEKWHKQNFVKHIIFFIWCGLICIYFSYDLMASFIFNGINMYGLLFFINDNDFI